jgi:hypothetical protein
MWAPSAVAKPRSGAGIPVVALRLRSGTEPKPPRIPQVADYGMLCSGPMNIEIDGRSASTSRRVRTAFTPGPILRRYAQHDGTFFLHLINVTLDISRCAALVTGLNERVFFSTTSHVTLDIHRRAAMLTSPTSQIEDSSWRTRHGERTARHAVPRSFITLILELGSLSSLKHNMKCAAASVATVAFCLDFSYT